MDWRNDIDAIPKGRFESIPHPNGRGMLTTWEAPPVILASKCGKVMKSRWLPPTDVGIDRRKVGRWEFYHTGEQPVAWMPWPEHPGAE